MIKTNDITTFSKEREILKKILEEKFREVMLYNLKNTKKL